MPEKPDIKLDLLEICINGRQFPGATDFWDGNWLNVDVVCDSGQSRVKAAGPIVHLSELHKFKEQLRKSYETLNCEAALCCTEPNLQVKLTPKQRGHFALCVDITPDHMAEAHRFNSEIDQSYLPALIKQLNEVLTQFPLREPGRLDERAV